MKAMQKKLASYLPDETQTHSTNPSLLKPAYNTTFVD